MKRSALRCLWISSLLLAGGAAAPAAAAPASAFVWASGEEAPAGASAEQTARHHLARLGAPADLRLLYVHDTGRGGIIVALRPRIDGVDVLHGDLKVLLDRSHRLLAVSGRPADARAPRTARSFATGPAAAVAAALRGVHGADVPADRLAPAPARAGEAAFTLAGPGPRLRRPARARPVYFLAARGLVPAYRVELRTLDAAGAAEGHAVVVAADDGRVLERTDLIARAGYKYRVWADADATHTPFDGPLEDYTPHPLGEPKGDPQPGPAPTLVTMEGFNTNPDGVADPWLPPDAKDTRGNNVDAYATHTDPEGPDTVLRATPTAPGVFDHPYDVAGDPLASEAQVKAAITQLFYTNNWLHDWWYDSGFNEAAGNAQLDNFGRGGADGDPLFASAQDGVEMNFRDNAYMETPEDGDSPTMHMFVWSSLSTQVELTLLPADQALEVGQAYFGPKVYDLTAAIAELDDGAGMNPKDGCEPAKNDLTGKIALIDRGTCSFELKTQHAADAGAVGAIYVNILDAPGGFPPGPPDYDMPDPPIPAQGISKADGAALRAALKNGVVNGHMVGDSAPERDGSIDGMIVAHEWGHYLHNRLVDCVSYACSAQGEGWADFVALHRSLREGDDLDGTYGASGYASFDPTLYFGIRRYPYSVDLTKNPLTFRHITDGEPLPMGPASQPNGIENSETHNAGEIWASMLWEVYVALHKANGGKKTFDEVRRAMSDYIVGGMMLAPSGPTHLEQRDALLAAIAAQDPADFVVAAEAFARRGAGTCAVGPARESMTFDGVLEDFELRSAGAIASITVDDATLSCDGDGVLDADETGLVTVVVRNNGPSPLVGASLSVVAETTSLLFIDGNGAPIADLAPASEVALTFPVELTGPLPDVESITISAILKTPDGCTTETIRSTAAILDGDAAKAIATVDDVEADDTLWTISGLEGEDVWSRRPGPFTGKVWHAEDLGILSDGWLASPALKVSADEPLTISFEHAHAFDASQMGDAWIDWDGGVLEITKNEGQSWDDISVFGDPGYTGTLTDSNNPLSTRPAYVRTNPSYPQPDKVTIDLGTKLAGEKIRLRFRLGTDGAVGAPGWDVDNIAFTGVTNTPFAGWIPDACGGAQPTTSDGSSGDGSSGEPGSSSSGDPATGGQQPLDDGCGCRSGAPSGPSLALLLLLGLARGRRRRRA